MESIFCFQVSFSHSFFCAIGFWNSMHDLGFSSFGFHLIHFIQSVKIITCLDLVMHCCDRFSQPCAGTSSSSGCFRSVPPARASHWKLGRECTACSQTHHEILSPHTHLLGCYLPQWVSLLLLASHPVY